MEYGLSLTSWVKNGERTFVVVMDGAVGEGRTPSEAALNALEAYDGAETGIMIASVMHTGTTFLRNVFRPKRVRHIQEEPTLAEVEAAPIVAVPLRHPAKVWRSWVWRGRPMTLFWLSWHLLDWYDRRFGEKMVVIPVDLPGMRDHCLAELGQRAKKRFQTDWQPRNEWKHERTEVELPDLSPLWDYPIVRQFYGNEITA